MFPKKLKMTVSAAIVAMGAALPAFADDLSSMSWDEIVAQAQEEGSVTWYQWYLQPEMREVVKAFEEEYGITVTIPEGGGGANRDKLIAETGRAEGDIDVISLWTGALAEMTQGDVFLQVTGAIPGGDQRNTTPENWDTEGYAVAFWGNQAGIAYNTARVNAEDLPQTVEEFSAWMEANPYGLGFNVAEGGSGKGWFSSVARDLVPGVDFDAEGNGEDELATMGPVYEWFNARENQFIITASNADSVTRLNDGEFLMVPSYEDFVAGLQSRGEISSDIGFYIPEMGMPGGANVVGVPANAPNPAAAFVFVEWLTSAETQAGFNKQFGSVPQHPEASDEFALIPASQRGFTINWPKEPFLGEFTDGFIENVVQN